MKIMLAALAAAALCAPRPALADPPSAAPPAAPSDAPCVEGESASQDADAVRALDAFERCAAIEGQTPFLIARARLGRLAVYEKLGKRAEAEAELLILTAPPVSDYPVFVGVPPEMMRAVLEQRSSVGISQARLLARLAGYRATRGDAAGAVAAAEKSLRLVVDKPDAMEDASAAFVIRAKAYVAAGNQRAALPDVVRAYVRGAKDEWVVAQVKQFPAEAQTELDAIRAALAAAVRPTAGASGAPSDGSAAEPAAANAARDEALKREEALVGPLAWTTP